VEASREVISAAAEIYKSPDLNGISIYLRPEIHYAAIDTGTEIAPCKADGKGGHLVVHCIHEQPGTLIIQEHALEGWRATRDGQAIPLQTGPWLSVTALPGEHEYVFEYSPWDIKVGLILFGISIALLLSLLNDPRKRSV
jgi:hypothetical protein